MRLRSGSEALAKEAFSLGWNYSRTQFLTRILTPAPELKLPKTGSTALVITQKNLLISTLAFRSFTKLAEVQSLKFLSQEQQQKPVSYPRFSYL